RRAYATPGSSSGSGMAATSARSRSVAPRRSRGSRSSQSVATFAAAMSAAVGTPGGTVTRRGPGSGGAGQPASAGAGPYAGTPGGTGSAGGISDGAWTRGAGSSVDAGPSTVNG